MASEQNTDDTKIAAAYIGLAGAIGGPVGIVIAGLSVVIGNALMGDNDDASPEQKWENLQQWLREDAARWKAYEEAMDYWRYHRDEDRPEDPRAGNWADRIKRTRLRGEQMKRKARDVWNKDWGWFDALADKFWDDMAEGMRIAQEQRDAGEPKWWVPKPKQQSGRTSTDAEPPVDAEAIDDLFDPTPRPQLDPTPQEPEPEAPRNGGYWEHVAPPPETSPFDDLFDVPPEVIVPPRNGGYWEHVAPPPDDSPIFVQSTTGGGWGPNAAILLGKTDALPEIPATDHRTPIPAGAGNTTTSNGGSTMAGQLQPRGAGRVASSGGGARPVSRGGGATLAARGSGNTGQEIQAMAIGVLATKHGDLERMINRCRELASQLGQAAAVTLEAAQVNRGTTATKAINALIAQQYLRLANSLTNTAFAAHQIDDAIGTGAKISLQEAAKQEEIDASGADGSYYSRAVGAQMG